MQRVSIQVERFFGVLNTRHMIYWTEPQGRFRLWGLNARRVKTAFCFLCDCGHNCPTGSFAQVSRQAAVAGCNCQDGCAGTPEDGCRHRRRPRPKHSAKRDQNNEQILFLRVHDVSQTSQSSEAGSEARTKYGAGSRSQREGSSCDFSSAACPQEGQMADESPGTGDIARGRFSLSGPAPSSSPRHSAIFSARKRLARKP